MTQFQFDTIIRIIQSGAPALAKELCEAMVNLVEAKQNLERKVEDLTKELDANKSLKMCDCKKNESEEI
jgi:hypothetical protein